MDWLSASGAGSGSAIVYKDRRRTLGAEQPGVCGPRPGGREPECCAPKDERTPREWPNENAGGLAARAEVWYAELTAGDALSAGAKTLPTRSVTSCFRWLEADLVHGMHYGMGKTSRNEGSVCGSPMRDL